MNEYNPNSIPETNLEESNFFTVKNLVLKFVLYWHWFLASLLVCLIGSYVLLRFQCPVYSVNGSVIIKEDKSKGSSNAAAKQNISALADMGMLSMTNNFDNEVEILKSRTLIQKVITDLGLYININKKQDFKYSQPLYKNSPVNVWMDPAGAEALKGGVTINMECNTNGTLDLEIIHFVNKEKIAETHHVKKLPATIVAKAGIITFTRNENIAIKEHLHLEASISNPVSIAAQYKSLLTVNAVSKTTTIAQLNVQNTHKDRGVDFLNTLIKLYNQDANDEKNEVAQKTADFIDERIAIINEELGHTENRLESFKKNAGLTDLSSDAQLALTESSKYEQERIQNATQISLVEFLQGYVNNPANENEVIPSNVGLDDKNLTSIVDQYNEKLLEKKRLMRSSNEANPALQLASDQVSLLRKVVITTI